MAHAWRGSGSTVWTLCALLRHGSRGRHRGARQPRGGRRQGPVRHVSDRRRRHGVARRLRRRAALHLCAPQRRLGGRAACGRAARVPPLHVRRRRDSRTALGAAASRRLGPLCAWLRMAHAAPCPRRRRYKTGEDEYQSLPEFNTLPPEQFEGVISSDPSMCVLLAFTCSPPRALLLMRHAPLLRLRCYRCWSSQVHEPLVRPHMLV